MPRIKRWFPVSHDINRDPEMWDLEAKFGGKALHVWLELLSIADRNDGDIPGELDGISTAVSWASRIRTTKGRRILDDMLTRGWLHVDGCLKVSKWLEYHRTRGPNKAPSEPSEPSEPSYPKKNTSVSPKGFTEFWTSYPKKKSKGQAEKAWKSLNVTPELLETILNGVRRAKQSRAWLKDSGQYIPHPATWLRAKGWEDQEFVSYSASKPVPKVDKPEEKPTDEEIQKSQEFIRETIHSLADKMKVKK
jgi:hypothetical protein